MGETVDNAVAGNVDVQGETKKVRCHSSYKESMLGYCIQRYIGRNLLPHNIAQRQIAFDNTL